VTGAPRRRGARRLIDVDPQLLRQLEAGQVSTLTHVEHMAIDQSALWAITFPSLVTELERFTAESFIGRLRLGGRMLFEAHGPGAWTAVQSAEPDTVRAWRVFAIAAADMALADKLTAVKPFAEDAHFGVREWAWLALREDVCRDPHAAVRALVDSLANDSVRWRRFASEVTRPRSVWGRHIREFKQAPWDAEHLLVALLAEHDRYVLVSVTNWLNDVYSSHSEWVLSVCACAADNGVNYEWFTRRATRGRSAHRADGS
jgi:3-methyladenine DNA glycosylase AlkC